MATQLYVPLKRLPELSDMMKDEAWARDVKLLKMERALSVPTGKTGGEPRMRRFDPADMKKSRVQVMTWMYSEGVKGYRFYAADAPVFRHGPTDTYWTTEEGFDAILSP